MASEEICPNCNSENVRRVYSWTDVGARTVLEILGFTFIASSLATGGIWYLAACIGTIIIVVLEVKYPRAKLFFCDNCNKRFSVIGKTTTNIVN